LARHITVLQWVEIWLNRICRNMSNLNKNW
jgi:hypothetical protein